jgi:hypothetical protein
MPDPGEKDPNAIRYEDQEVCRSNTELTDEGPQGGAPSYPLDTGCQLGILGGEGRGGGGGDLVWSPVLGEFCTRCRRWQG